MSARVTATSLLASLAAAAAAPLASAQEAETREVTTFKFLDAPPTWVIALVIVPAIIALCTFVYRREGEGGAPAGARAACGVLRGLAFVALFLFLFRPVLETHEVEIEKSVVPILLDGSSSMRRSDAYADGEVADRLARTSGLGDAARVSETTRIDLMKEILARPETDPAKVLADRNEVRYYSFGDEIRSLAETGDLRAEGHYTRLGTAIAEVQAEFASRGRRVSEMLVLSDGRSNSGLDPAEAAARAALDGIRIVTVGVGDPNEPKNIAIQSVRAPDVALVNDDVAFEVVISADGYEGRVTSLVLRPKGSEEVLASVEVTLPRDGRDLNEVLFWRPEREGEYDLEVVVVALGGEQFLDDNVRAHHLRVDPEEIRVLYVEGYPRWEYRFLKNILLRAKNMRAQCLLLDADQDFIQESTEGLPALTRFPPDKKALFEYDVVILGDVDPYRIAPNVEESERTLALLKEFVEIGGGLIMVAGVLDNPRAYVGTPLEDVLPVVLGDGEEERMLRSEGYIQPFRPRLESPLDPHEVVRLEKDLRKNRLLWEDPEVGLPPQEWYYPVRKPKGGAEVMLRHPTNENQFGRHVLMASTFYPSGRTLFLAFDSTWLWRRFYGDRYTERFWRASIRYVALNKIRRTNKRFELLTDKSLYDINEAIQVSARIRDVDFDPLARETFAVQLEDEQGRSTPIDLSNVDPDEGLFEGTLRLGLPGQYQVWLEDWTGREPGRLSPKSFRVEVPQHEWENPVLARDTLESIAEATKGAYFGLDAFADALGDVEGEVRERPKGEPTRNELWSSWPALLAFLAFLAAEWILRKRANLV